MKSIKFIILVSLGFAICSCEDFLNPLPESAVVTDTFFETDADVLAGIIGVYDAIQGVNENSETNETRANRGVQFEYLLTEHRTDNTRGATTEGSKADFHRYLLNANNVESEDYYQSMYEVVFRSNNIMAFVPEAADEDNQGRYLAELKFLRAYAYFNLVRLYGDVPLVMKYSAQGMGHGHFDKLAYSLYNETGEVVQDYGAARWVNIDQKGGGRYLPENNTWAKQSVAHNTLVIDETSHYNGDIRIGEQHHPDRYAFVTDDPGLQLISAKANNVYPGRELHRSQWLLTDEEFTQPLLIDIFRSEGGAAATHDLPTWYHGQLLQTNLPVVTNNMLSPLGEKHGYQHLWAEGSATVDTNLLQFNFFHEGTFYTQSSVALPGDEFLLVRLGANDPDFNLRRDQATIHRRPGVSTTTFVSLLETHGSYDPREEVARDPYGHVSDLQLVVDTEEYTAISFRHEAGTEWYLLLANQHAAAEATHKLNINGTAYQWSGVHHLIKLNHESK